MLVIFDRGFYSYDFFAAARDTGADLLFRVTASLKLPVLQRLPDDSYLSAITPKRISTPVDARRGAVARREPGRRSSCGSWSTRSPTAIAARSTG